MCGWDCLLVFCVGEMYQLLDVVVPVKARVGLLQYVTFHAACQLIGLQVKHF